jgi:VCBS repeat-containing protein
VHTNPPHGTLSGTAPNLVYTPAKNYYGPDSFTYKASDGKLDSNVATVSITVARVNQPPVSTGDSYATNENTPLSVASPGILGNDTDPDNNPLTAALVTGPAHGTLSLNANGSFVYTPAQNYYGSDSFTYKPFDGALYGNATTVTLTVNHVNQPPVAVNNAYTVAKNGTLSVAAPGILGNDTDPDGNALKAVLVQNVSHGTLTLNANGSFTYKPKKNFTGTDQFTYRASDGSLQSNVATITLTVSKSGAAHVTAQSASVPSPGASAVTDVAIASLASPATDPGAGTPSTASAAGDPITLIMPDVSVLEELALAALNGKHGKSGLGPAGA